MLKRGKKYKKVVKKAGDSLRKVYKLKDAFKKLKDLSYSKFPGTVEIHFDINVPTGRDPKSIKGNVTLPHTQAKDVTIAVAIPTELSEKAKQAGADIYDFDKIVKNVKSGKLNFDVLIAVPQSMPQLAPLGKALGPKGLMPNPKSGTVVPVEQLEKAVQEFKQGKLVFKADASGGIHVAIGKINDSTENLLENTQVLINAIVSLLGKSKEYLIKNLYVAPTMGPALKVDLKSV